MHVANVENFAIMVRPQLDSRVRLVTCTLIELHSFKPNVAHFSIPNICHIFRRWVIRDNIVLQ
jgi:hypothetical protein